MQIARSEVQSGQLSPDTLKHATRELQDVGYVVLEQALDPRLVERVRNAYAPLFEAHIQRPEIRAKIDAGNPYVGMHLPFRPPFSDELICANPLAVQVMEAAMGDIVCTFYHSNTTLTGTDIQPIHIDMPSLLTNLAERCVARPSVRTNVCVGDLVVRDLRVWHRGMPNQTNAIRTMLALVYHRPWFHNPPYIQIPRASLQTLSEHAQQIFAPNVMVD
jgi:hypothetical protein